MAKKKQTTTETEAAELSQAISSALGEIDDESEESDESELAPPPDLDLRRPPSAVAATSLMDFDPDIRDLNDASVTQLGEVPMLGGRNRADIFGQTAETIGRPSSPPLYASASQWPEARQFRVWKMVNGNPHAIGVIACDAGEDEFISHFYDSMPKRGEGQGAFRLRPVNAFGKEIGKEVMHHISENHTTLKRLREEEKQALLEQQGRWGGGRDIIMPGGGEGVTALSEEIGRIMEQTMDMANEQTDVLRKSLEQERERARQAERDTATERINMAHKATEATEKMADRMMSADRQRSEELMRSQQESSKFVLQLMTAQQAQSREAAQLESQRQREFFERQRAEIEDRRRYEREEAEARRTREREEQRAEIERREQEHKARIEQQRLEMEQRRIELLEESKRRELEEERRRARDREDWERKMAAERDERERKERQDRERWEREKLEWEKRREEDRREQDRRAELRREEIRQEEQRRREEMQMQMKQLEIRAKEEMQAREIQAQRDREHAEKMMAMAKLEREEQREARERQLRLEQEQARIAEAARQRQHEMEMKRIEQQSREGREHQERMMQLQQQQNGGFGALGELLGMNTPELLERVFGGKEEGWADAAPKIMGGLAEFFGKMAAGGMPGGPGGSDEGGPRPSGQPQIVTIQTPDGPRQITMDQFRALQAEQERINALQQQEIVPPLPAGQEATASAEKPQSPASKDEVDEFDKAAEADTNERCKSAGVSLDDRRDARKAIRTLVKQLGKANESEWEQLVNGTVMVTPSVLPYLEAVGVWAAVVEAKADRDLAVRIVKAVQEAEAGLRELSGRDTPLLPFTEADIGPFWERKRAEEQSESAESGEGGQA